MAAFEHPSGTMMHRCDLRSESVRVPINVLLAIIRAHPAAGVHFATVIASQVESKQQASLHPMGEMPVTSKRSPGTNMSDRELMPTVMPSYGLSLATIAVVPLTLVDITGFCGELLSALNEIAPAEFITKTIVREKLGDKTYQPQNALHEMKITRVLCDAEEKQRLVVYQANLKYTSWTQLAIKQADCILLLVRAEEAPEKKQLLAWDASSDRVGGNFG